MTDSSTTNLELWLVIASIAVGSFALRFSFIGWFRGREIPPWLTRTLRFIPPAILSALIGPAVASQGGAEAPQLAPILAAALAVLLAWRSRSLLLPIGGGMAALWILGALFQL